MMTSACSSLSHLLCTRRWLRSPILDLQGPQQCSCSVFFQSFHMRALLVCAGHHVLVLVSQAGLFRVFFYCSRDHKRGMMTSYLGSLAFKSWKLTKITPNFLKLLNHYILSNASQKVVGPVSWPLNPGQNCWENSRFSPSPPLQC